MSEYSAKTLREKAKAKARALANPGNYAKDQEVSSADWSPAPPLRTEMKTGARPIMKPSAKGTGESYAARDTKAAIGKDMKRGAFKAGGAVKRKDGGSVPSKAETQTTEKRIGKEEIVPKRGAAQHYKKGGKIKKAGGGSFLEKMVGGSESEKQARSMRDVGKSGTANYTQEDKGALNRALKGDDALPAAGEAAERSGKYQNYKKGGRTAKATGGGLFGALKGAAKKVSKKGGKTDINIVINAGKSEPRHPEAAMRRPTPDMAPPPAMDVGAAAPAMPPMGGLPELSSPAPYKRGGRVGKLRGGPMMGNQPMGKPMPATRGMPVGRPMPATRGMPVGRPMPAPQGMPVGRPMPAPQPVPVGPGPRGGFNPMMARKAGGRITKVAKSYKDMQAGSGNGEGRLQKTDIAKLHKDAPVRKAGGRISRVAKSYKDMTAGSASGEGRLQKEDIAKAKKGRGR